jgi:membrane protease YdiL (CAAX protease family)
MTISSIVFVVITGLVMPSLAYVSKRQLDRGLKIPRLQFYTQTIILQMLLLAGSFYVASRNRIILFRNPELNATEIGLGLLMFAATYGAMLLSWRSADSAARERLRLFVPSNPVEKVVWSAVSLAASCGEEVAYRGVLVAILHRELKNWWIAVLVSSIFFALAHLVQGGKSSVVVGVFGFMFHLLVAATGGLYVSILVHFAYNLAAGFTLSRLLSREERTLNEPAV